ncbi:MAG: signal peptide peptidase SppA [Deltaproteobacteria bacterium]
MNGILKRFFCFSTLLAIASVVSGCMVFTLPGVEPLEEKVIGGSGPARVLLIDVSGVIRDEDGTGLLGVETRMNTLARIKEELTRAEKDDSVKAVVLRINSPGGAVTTCDIINHEISVFKAKRKIPVVAELMDVAASGGYYVAVAADSIVAHPTTVTGSIGVVAYSVNAGGLMEKLGISNQTIKSGDKKDIGSPLRKMTDEERAILSSIIDDMHQRFLNAVMRGRKNAHAFELNELKGIADGRVYTANQALGLKLIDSIGYLEDAVGLAKKLAGVKDATLITYAPRSSYRANMYSGIGGATPPQVNLINMDIGGGLSKKFGLNFLYLWMP